MFKTTTIHPMKTVLITGANQGIGLAAAKILALDNDKYHVYIGSRDRAKGAVAVAALQEAGARHISLLQIDVTGTDSIHSAAQVVAAEAGALDILINNAAIAGDKDQSIHQGALSNLRVLFETNFFGAVQVTQAFLPLLEKAPLPVIVNVSSELGSLHTHLATDSANYLNYDAYSASKTALNALSVLLAGQLKNKAFKINSVTPGYTATNLNNYQGFNTVEEAAKVIVQYATIDQNGPTGGFFSRQGAVPW